MSIDALVAYVYFREDGSGSLTLATRDGVSPPGQPEIDFASAPHEVTALNGLPVWGGDQELMLGDIAIAKRIGYSRIAFYDDATFKRALVALKPTTP